MTSCSELDSVSSCLGHESLCPVHEQTTTRVKLINVHAVTLSSPSTILSFTEKASQSSHVSHVIDSDQQSHNGAEASRVLQSVHISSRLMEDFLELAKDNTEKDLETCGVLGAFLERGTFYVTTLIIPKQESTSNSCQAISEEEIFSIQNERSLFPLGWIHTHPSQSCFMSSIDLHTQYSYQVMVPEAFAIVVAPKDNSRSYGIYRVCDPSGMNVLKECQEKGSQFHSHKETENGNPIYEHCTHVYKNSNLRCCNGIGRYGFLCYFGPDTEKSLALPSARSKPLPYSWFPFSTNWPFQFVEGAIYHCICMHYGNEIRDISSLQKVL